MAKSITGTEQEKNDYILSDTHLANMRPTCYSELFTHCVTRSMSLEETTLGLLHLSHVIVLDEGDPD